MQVLNKHYLLKSVNIKSSKETRTKKTLQEYYHGRLRKLMTLTSDIFPNVN